MSNPLNLGSRRTLAAALLAGALTTLGLAGCGGSDAAGGTPVPAAAPSAAASTGLVVKDPWVKAAKAGTMTAAFAILVNDSATDITVVSAESPASPMELHEMTMQDGQMLMRPKQGGFVIKARSTHELGPGGDHLMLMKPAAAIDAGNEVTFTLKLADGGTVPFTAIAKPFAGAGESYDPGMSMPASGMPMASMGSAAP